MLRLLGLCRDPRAVGRHKAVAGLEHDLHAGGVGTATECAQRLGDVERICPLLNDTTARMVIVEGTEPGNRADLLAFGRIALDRQVNVEQRARRRVRADIMQDEFN